MSGALSCEATGKNNWSSGKLANTKVESSVTTDFIVHKTNENVQSTFSASISITLKQHNCLDVSYKHYKQKNWKENIYED